MRTQTEKAEEFLALHHAAAPLLLPNPWDPGSAKLFASLGFEALATTSSGFAATLGRLDGEVTRDEALAHAASIVKATDLPVSADFENGFADEPAGVAQIVELAVDAGLAGCSVEDFTGRSDVPIYDAALARDRIAAAAEAAHRGSVQLALPGSPTVAELAKMGVRRISVGGAFAFAAMGAAAEAARELRDEGTYGYWKQARAGSDAARSAFVG